MATENYEKFSSLIIPSAISLNTGETTVSFTNVGDEAAVVSLEWHGDLATDALTGQQFLSENGKVTIKLPPLDGMLLI